MELIDRIETLFGQHGHLAYEGRRRASVNALEHALQCAQLAEWAHASDSLVAAALLHDVGHFVERAASVDAQADGVDDAHEMRAVPFLAEGFGASVVEPVRLHVQAKRYLVASDPKYLAGLSPASVHSLFLQGGPMPRDEALLFESLPYAEDAVALRRWDDLAKKPGGRTPPLAYYLPMLQGLSADRFRRPGRLKSDATSA
jgi:phosphonate degradation associated HDIG domain protein